MERDGKVKQRQHFFHHGDTVCHPKSGYITKQTGRLYVDATIMRSSRTELFSSFLPSTYACNVNLAAAKPSQFMPNLKDGSPVEFDIILLCCV